MKKTKQTRNKRSSDTEIDQFCQGVEDILHQIKTRSRSKKRKKSKENKGLAMGKDLLVSQL